MELSKEFVEKVENSFLDELENIYETQKESYTPEELEFIGKRIEFLKTEEECLPEPIKCPKCGFINTEENEYCSFCRIKLDGDMPSERVLFEVITKADSEKDISHNFISKGMLWVCFSVIIFLVALLLFELREHDAGMVFAVMASTVFALSFDYIISKEFEYIANEKGYKGTRYFWYSFFLGFVGYLFVIALPKKDNPEKVE